MLTRVDMTRIPSYRMGVEKGEATFLRRQLGHEFGTLPPAIEKRIECPPQ
uniref:Uncharacterized protein n=1 Tax=Candidatus Kentrum sp. TUN TaxID=2126343 RepID=A0A450ZHZ2_9GAMM|nr:MAG: hypothetical protein BECKTUN1418D_GA0071000_10093 [Candidatus Kentron sp. TUN]VFK53389.1 MAG: hypothetical protein BECKTUN1418F_GA0071002_101926 [Candidatus Kentron sp. TUN]VFK55231.1 MAG: hypothetical protein BECKTUN1418E_GA0071001_102619 [Candidatus Kentron sp. TUN]